MSRAPRTQDPLYAGPRQPQRGPFDARSTTSTGAPTPRANGRTPDASDNSQSRAARFEDEKKRIIESVFAKRDEDGVQVESYITHIRILEDAMYPTGPSPPEADPGNKKNRVILVAVRKTGRVRVHKARENPNGSFSIGKTWNLDELGSIQSYTSLIPRSNQEQMEKQWAGGVGFIVTLGKAYYWQAPTAKEKDFFIASLIKIFRKYTGGKLPELYGFAPEEVEALTGVPSAQPSSQPVPNNEHAATPPPLKVANEPPRLPTPSDRRPYSPFSTRSQTTEPTREPTPRYGTPGAAEIPSRDAQRTPFSTTDTSRSPARHRPSFGSDVPAPPAPLFASASRASPSPQSSQTSLAPSERMNVTAANGLPSRPKPSFGEPSQSTPSIHSTSSRPSTAVSEQKSFDQRSDRVFSSDEPPPDRKRPFQSSQASQVGSRSGLASESESSFTTPAVSTNDPREAIPVRAAVVSGDTTSSPSPLPQKDYFKPTGQSESSPIVSPSEPASATLSSNASPLSPESAAAKEEFRPGLGPMIKKKSAKDIAGQFRKAAMAAGAFQPRQGGGAARFKALKEKEKAAGEPDGITGVIPAPLARGLASEKSPATPVSDDVLPDKLRTPVSEAVPAVQLERVATQDSVASVDIPLTKSAKESVAALQTPVAAEQPRSEKRQTSPDKARSRSPQRRKRQRQQAEVAKYCSSLGIDSRIFDGKGADFNDLLTEFGWHGRLLDERRIEEFEGEIRREIGRAQAAGWLGHVEQQEGKVQDLAKAFDKAIEECEELDGLFTLYSHELETLAADIEYIEAQSQGLQVQTANQKLLQNELQNLLKTLTIPADDLRGIKNGTLDTSGGVEKVEKSLALLYEALVTIDPEIRTNRLKQAGASADKTGVGVYADAEIGQMRAVREKKEDYREETMTFVRRFNQHMTNMFKQIEQRHSEDTTRSTISSTRSMDNKPYLTSRQELWTYSAMMLFVREVNNYEWQTLINIYETNIKRSYQDQFRDIAMARRRNAHKPTGEELEALFVTQEKDRSDEGLATTAARKLTVRRGKNPRTGNLKQNANEKRDGKPDSWEVFEGVLQSHSKAIAEEQNFIVHFFHISSQANVDFAEIINSRSPAERKLPNLNMKLSYEPDRQLAKIVQVAIESIYHFWPQDLQNLLDWAIGVDQLQGVGVLCALEQCLAAYEETNQEYITRTVRTVHDRLVALFHRFIDEQIKAIEETKVKVKKRRGIISFMRTFPIFSSVIEHMIPVEMSVQDSLEVRFIVNESYNKVLKAMWESLNFIAKDDPIRASSGVHSSAPTSGDPEDKEALNYHILLIENMSHYLEEVDTNNIIVLEEWAEKAKKDMDTHTNQYVEAIMRRPLGKWLDFVESAESMMRNNDSAASIANKPSHSRSSAKKVLAAHDAKEVRKGIETLKRRVEKHFGDVDDPSAGGKNLIAKMCDECSHKYISAWDRMNTIIDQLYDGSLEIDWKREEIQPMFKSK